MCELSTMPNFELGYFARKIAKMMDSFYENPENKKRFEEWERQENAKNDTM